MRARHLSPAGVVVVAVVMLTACTTATTAPEFDRATAAQQYVELLRGANDLAHGSLDVPSSSTLPAFAAMSSALRHVDRPAPEVSTRALEQLTRRSGEDPAWAAFYLCEATGGDIPVVTAIAPPLPPASPEIDSVNAAADRIIAESARACLGLAPSLDEADWSALQRQVSGNALVGVQLAGLARRLGHPVPSGLLSSADVAGIEGAIEADGCTDWVLANSVAARALAAVPEATDAVSLADLPSRVAECAASDSVVLTDPTSLGYLVAADIPPAQLGALLDANVGIVERALAVEGSIASTNAAPSGNGTIASSRDAVLFLRLSGSAGAPAWLSDGVRAAVDGELTASDTIDALYLCAALELDCPDAFLAHARELTLDAVEAALAEPTDAAARAVEAAVEDGRQLPHVCTRERVTAWLDDHPQLLAAFAAGEKECVQLLELDDATLTPLARDAIDDLRLEDALAYCLLRLLAGDARPHDSLFTTTTRDGLADLWSRLDAENGDDYLASARPLRIELAQAKEDQWLN